MFLQIPRRMTHKEWKEMVEDYHNKTTTLPFGYRVRQLFKALARKRGQK